MESSLVVPVAFWNGSQPTFRISSIRITPNGSKLVASSYDGELITWNVWLERSEITPRNVLIGHSDPVSCLECTDDYVISASEGGEINRWNLSDGYCSKSVRSVFVHRRIQLFHRTENTDDDLLLACGDYQEIFVMNSVILQTILVLHSKTDSDWITCFQAMTSMQMGSDVVSAVTRSGHIKLWVIENLSDEILYEVQSSLMPVTDICQMKFNANQTQLLIICDKSWTVFDANFLKPICSAHRICNEKFLGGDFIDSSVIIWTSECKFYVFKLQMGAAKLDLVFFGETHSSNLFEPAMFLHKSLQGRYLVQCDITASISFWKIGGDSKPYFTCNLKDKVRNIGGNLFQRYTKEVTCCIVLSGLDLFAVGCSDGTIIIVSATKTVLSSQRGEHPDYTSLIGHRGRINCLLYPHERFVHHSKSHLLSGGSDFSVCLWDVFRSKLIHRFCVQSGEIIKLLVPPEECRRRVRQSVCSVAGDHSVAMLNLKELKCIVLASRQQYPIVTINWRPLDDFIIIECFDGTVFVWEMETGHLDRVFHGVTAQEVIYACKESNNEDVSNFYLREDGLVCHFRRGLFFMEKDLRCCRKDPIAVSGFLIGPNSECQILMFNIPRIISQTDRKRLRKKMIDSETYFKVKSLTDGTTTSIRPQEGEEEEDLQELGKFLLSVLTSQRRDAHCCLLSESFNVSVFLSPVCSTFNAVAAAALLSASNDSPPDEGTEFQVETLARLWQNRSLTVRRIARKELVSCLRQQTPQQRYRLLQRWHRYLPHFSSRIDRDLRMTSLVLFALVGADFRFDPTAEEIYTTETCSAILFSLRDDQTLELRAAAADLLGRGYRVWERYLPLDDVLRVLFEMTSQYDSVCFSDDVTPELDVCLNGRTALQLIASIRTEGFLEWLTREMAVCRSSPKTGNDFMDKSKPEVILALSDLLERSPQSVATRLNDVVTGLVFCISFGHLKVSPVTSLTPSLSRYPQVDHNLQTQRIVVGLADGGVVIHELRTCKTHRIASHGSGVDAVAFSPNGKTLATYCHEEGRLSFWNVFSAFFGLGHVHAHCVRSCDAGRLDALQISWTDNKSVLLRLSDGTENVFHV